MFALHELSFSFHFRPEIVVIPTFPSSVPEAVYEAINADDDDDDDDDEDEKPARERHVALMTFPGFRMHETYARAKVVVV